MDNKFRIQKDKALMGLDQALLECDVDLGMLPLIDFLNSVDDYYTTSSCSGRIILMIEQDKKAENLFISVYHDKASFKKLKEGLSLALKQNKDIKFKLEPCILHISCRTLKDAEEIYNKAKLAGWKKSGIIGMKSGFVAELNGTDRLEFPIIRKKNLRS